MFEGSGEKYNYCFTFCLFQVNRRQITHNEYTCTKIINTYNFLYENCKIGCACMFTCTYIRVQQWSNKGLDEQRKEDQNKELYYWSSWERDRLQKILNIHRICSWERREREQGIKNWNWEDQSEKWKLLFVIMHEPVIQLRSIYLYKKKWGHVTTAGDYNKTHNCFLVMMILSNYSVRRHRSFWISLVSALCSDKHVGNKSAAQTAANA